MSMVKKLKLHFWVRVFLNKFLLFLKGELVGGLDIIKELKQSGELEQTLKGKTA